jgi:hypothetical protein
MRSHLCALFIALNIPAFWLTINPADLRCPLILCLAGIKLLLDDFSQEAHQIWLLTTTMNPIAIAQFFHVIYTNIFNTLFCINTGQDSILGNILNHFGVMETNRRGMLYLHCLI